MDCNRLKREKHQGSTPDRPLISIIIPVFNAGSTLEATLRSIINQAYEAIEIIVIDGKSHDETLDILSRYKRYIAVCLSEPDLGVYDAMNKGIFYARGDWLYFLGSDDVLLDDFSKIHKYLCEADTIYYGDVYLPKRQIRYDGKFSAYKITARNICHQSMFYPKRILEKYSYNIKYVALADYELNIRCYCDSTIKFVYIPLTIAIFEDASGISQTHVDSEFESIKMHLIKKGFPVHIYYISLIRTQLIGLLKRFGIFDIVLTLKYNIIRIVRR